MRPKSISILLIFLIIIYLRNFVIYQNCWIIPNWWIKIIYFLLNMHFKPFIIPFNSNNILNLAKHLIRNVHIIHTFRQLDFSSRLAFFHIEMKVNISNTTLTRTTLMCICTSQSTHYPFLLITKFMTVLTFLCNLLSRAILWTREQSSTNTNVPFFLFLWKPFRNDTTIFLYLSTFNSSFQRATFFTNLSLMFPFQVKT